MKIDGDGGFRSECTAVGHEVKVFSSCHLLLLVVLFKKPFRNFYNFFFLFDINFFGNQKCFQFNG